ncbi:MAG TPA: hypothetical protein P5017_10660 [Anaerohalosphaeraceae bacterium]|nr:hypothetical protein [Anaerohalosphaeraceae bacterium]
MGKALAKSRGSRPASEDFGGAGGGFLGKSSKRESKVKTSIQTKRDFTEKRQAISYQSSLAFSLLDISVKILLSENFRFGNRSIAAGVEKLQVLY